jgi:hypothetical protein
MELHEENFSKNTPAVEEKRIESRERAQYGYVYREPHVVVTSEATATPRFLKPIKF